MPNIKNRRLKTVISTIQEQLKTPEEQLSNSLGSIATSFLEIANSIKGIHEEVKRAGTRYWPEPGERKEVIVGHVLSEEEKLRKERGQSDGIPIEDWLKNLGGPEDEEDRIGERERQWRLDHPEQPESDTSKNKEQDASAKTDGVSGQASTSV